MPRNPQLRRRDAARLDGDDREDGITMPLSHLVIAWLPIALGVVMIGAGLVNFVGPAAVRTSFDRWGYPHGFHRVTGALEVAGGALLLVPATARIGAGVLVVILLAALATLVRHRDWSHLPGALLLTAAAVAVAAPHG